MLSIEDVDVWRRHLTLKWMDKKEMEALEDFTEVGGGADMVMMEGAVC